MNPPAPSTIPTGTPAAVRLTVANTGGLGVFVRRYPERDGDRIGAWPDGTPMIAVGGNRYADGREWQNVRDPAGTVGWVAAEFLAVASVGAPAGTPGGPPTPAPSLRPHVFELLWANGRWERDLAIVEGQVRNLGPDVAGVVAVIDWYGAGDRLVRSASTSLDVDPIPSGGSARFQSSTSDDRAMRHFRIAFKDLSGVVVPTRDPARP